MPPRTNKLPSNNAQSVYAGGGELGGRRDQPRHDHCNDEIARPVAGRTENAIKPDGAQHAEHGGDMTVRQGAPHDDAPPVGRRPIRPGFPVRVIVNRGLVIAPYQSAENDGDA